MSARVTYRREVVVNGKTYVRGPALPPGVDKHTRCAGSALGKCCFGHDCLHIEGLYWVEKTAPAEDAPVKMSTCPSCGKRRRSDRFESVVVSAGVTELRCFDCAEEHTGVCEYCGRACVKDALSDVHGGGSWCPDCRATHAATCERCGMIVPASSAKTVELGDGVTQTWCSECYVPRTFSCGHCNTLVVNERGVQVDNVFWCPSCANTHATECSLCGRRTGDTVDDPSGDGACVCRSCAENRSSGLVLGYHGLPKSTLKFWGDGPLFLGFELEAGNAPEDKYHRCVIRVNKIDPERRHYHMERDGSIPGNGFELVSAPHTLEEHKKYDWATVVKTMSANGLKSHDCGGRCGLHVHVSRAALSPSDLVNIDAFVLRNKTFWERVARRTQSDYARYIEKPDAQLGGGSERYCAVNFRNADTVEFRLFRGTLRYKTLMATLEIVDGLCRWAKTRTADQILRNEDEVGNFVAWLSDPERAADYAGAVEYITERRAVDDANSGVQDQTSPDV